MSSAINPRSVQRSVYDVSSGAAHPPTSSGASVGAVSSTVDVCSSPFAPPPASSVPSAGVNDGLLEDGALVLFVLTGVLFDGTVGVVGVGLELLVSSVGVGALFSGVFGVFSFPVVSVGVVFGFVVFGVFGVFSLFCVVGFCGA